MAGATLVLLSIIIGLIGGAIADIWLTPLHSAIVAGVVATIVCFAVAPCQLSSQISQEEEGRR